MTAKPEPTMEEILASIRRILAEDGPARADGHDDDGPDADPDPVPEARLAPAAETADPDNELLGDELLATVTDEPLPPEPAPPRFAEPEPGPRPEPASPVQNAGSLEGMVREMLQPMLKTWLDANLPEIVEQMVAREIARITRK